MTTELTLLLGDSLPPGATVLPLACGVLSAVGLLAVRHDPGARLRRVLATRPTPSAAWAHARRDALVVTAGLAAVLGLWGAAAAVAVCTVAGLGVVLRRRAARLKAAERRRAAVLAAGTAVAAALRAGLPAAVAWREAADAAEEADVGDDLLGGVARAPMVGADVADELLTASRRPGAEGLRRVGACWQVGAGAGAGLAGSLDVVCDGLRADQALRRQVAVELAAPRATARVLAVLPLAGAGLGAAAGARPWEVLLRTPIGHVCLAVGLALAAGGLLWVEALARRAEPT